MKKFTVMFPFSIEINELHQPISCLFLSVAVAFRHCFLKIIKILT